MPGIEPLSPDEVPPVRTVVVVDDHELLRAGTRRILNDATGFSVVGEAGDGDTALRVIADTRPDVVLVDIRLPGKNGIELAGEISADFPGTTVLILSAYDDENYVRASLAAGVAGYLLKTMPSDELVRSIRSACDGVVVGAPECTTARGDRSEHLRDSSPKLTARELQVVRLVARGMSNKAIAHQLGISPRTVEGHLNHVFDKLDTSSRTELVHFALANSLFRKEQTGSSESTR